MTWLEYFLRAGINYYPDCSKVEAFIHCKEENKPLQGNIVYGKISLAWNWIFTLAHFEIIHGLSRVVKLLPDKVQTAIEIKKENIPNEDGSFLIKLVMDLANVYLSDLTKLKVDVVADTVTTKIFSYDRALVVFADQPESLENVIVKFLTKLDDFKKSLTENNQNNIFKTAEALLCLADDILICCDVFLDLVHPVWISIKRQADQKLVLRQTKLTEKLKADLGGKLVNKFLELSRQNIENV